MPLTYISSAHQIAPLMIRSLSKLFVSTIVLSTATAVHADVEPGFVSLFDGKTLNGWQLVHQNGPGYGVKDGILFCQRGGGGNLFTTNQYENFIFRFDFRLEPGSNNGIGIHAPIEGDTAYAGIESQILDDTTKKYGPLQPWQMHGSLYGIVASKTGFQKPVGEWNSEEIIANGRHYKVILNGNTIIDADLNSVTDPAVLTQHIGLLRDRGYVGFLGHTDYVEFRNIRIKELPSEKRDNVAPEGFVALFNGKDLSGWKGQVENPAKRAQMTQQQLAEAQTAADNFARKHWKAENGEIVFDGKGKNLCTEKDYGDFEMLIDWKIPTDGDSGLYLRGCPQIQIWDPNSKKGKNDHSVGSGGVHNNVKNPRIPTTRADKPVGEWNRFRILMLGDKVSVYLNDELVVHNVTMENSVEKDKPLYPTGPIELQNHGGPLWFKNIYIRELPRKK